MDYIEQGYLTDESPRAIQPNEIKTQLFPHQLSMIQRCMELERKPYFINSMNGTKMKSTVGIICDPVGAGKSLSCLSLACNNKGMKLHDRCLFSSSGFFEVHKEAVSDTKILPFTVIVVPHGVYGQWEGYIKSETTIRTYYVNRGSTCFNPEGSSFYKKHITKGMHDVAKGAYKVVLVSAMQYQHFVNSLRTLVGVSKIYISRLIIDEVDSIRAKLTDRLPAIFTWFVSSSVHNLLHPAGGTQSIQVYDENSGSMVRKHERIAGIKTNGFPKDFFTSLTAQPVEMYWPLFMKNEKKFIDQSLNLPKFIRTIIKCGSPVSISVLSGLVSGDVIQMLNAGDVDGALESYTGETCNEDNIIKVVAGTLLANIRNLQIDLEATQKKSYSSENAKKSAIANIRSKIDDLNDKVNCIRERVLENDMCNICYDEPEHKVVTNCCQNIFCFQCIGAWFSDNHSTCPMCNNNMKEGDYILITDEEEVVIEKEEVEESAKEKYKFSEENDKIDNLKTLLQMRNEENETEGSKAKYLIFSSFDASFNRIKGTLKNLDMKCQQAKGNSQQIKSIISSYKTGDTDMLLLNARHFGAGLNLENTTDLIFYHEMDKDLEYQVIGRAQRPGRKGQLRIWYLYYPSESESASGKQTAN